MGKLPSAQPRVDGALTQLLPDLPVAGRSVILPDPGGVLTALARIGYDLEVALADLVDNSIDAKASMVLIRFLRTSDRILSLTVVDDGHGMTAERLEQAMGFGADTGKTAGELGKYGMGLKSASFSQCRSLTVISKQNNEVAARRWTADNIRLGWICDVIDSAAAARFLGQSWGPLNMGASGTVVRWDDLDAFRVARDRADGVLEAYFKRISDHLGLHFHRFLASGRLQITVDAVNDETGVQGSARRVEPLDPVGYSHTGRRSYPRRFVLNISGVGSLSVGAHIWPRRSRQPGYLLGGGKVAQRQGFYFYRNNRLIQAGGWNGWREDAEPHLSLARALVDFPGSYDRAFGLNVQKSAVAVPAGFLEALTTATSEGGSHSLSTSATLLTPMEGQTSVVVAATRPSYLPPASRVVLSPVFGVSLLQRPAAVVVIWFSHGRRWMPAVSLQLTMIGTSCT